MTKSDTLPWLGKDFHVMLVLGCQGCCISAAVTVLAARLCARANLPKLTHPGKHTHQLISGLLGRDHCLHGNEDSLAF